MINDMKKIAKYANANRGYLSYNSNEQTYPLYEYQYPDGLLDTPNAIYALYVEYTWRLKVIGYSKTENNKGVSIIRIEGEITEDGLKIVEIKEY